MNRSPDHLLPLDHYKEVTRQFLGAISQDDRINATYEAWVDGGRQGEAPEIIDVVGELSNSLMSQGMSAMKMVIIREAAYRIAEVAEEVTNA